MAEKLTQFLQSSRWRPYLLGSLASLPVTILALQVWKDHYNWALVWVGVCAFLIGARVFWRTPVRKLISTAILLGTLVFPMVLSDIFHDRPRQGIALPGQPAPRGP